MYPYEKKPGNLFNDPRISSKILFNDHNLLAQSQFQIIYI